MRLSLLREADWLGILTMALGLGALQTVLEEGNKDDWFGSPFIVRLAAIAAVCLSAFVVIELMGKKPAVNLRLLVHRNFGFGTLANMMLGFGLYGSVFLLPQYLGQVQGFNAEQIGRVMAWTGLPQLPLIPLVPLLMKKLDLRVLLIVGLGLFSYSCFMNGYMSADYSGDQTWAPQYRPRDRSGDGDDALDQPRHDGHREGGIGRGVRAVQHAAATWAAPSARRCCRPSLPSANSSTPTSSEVRSVCFSSRCGTGSIS